VESGNDSEQEVSSSDEVEGPPPNYGVESGNDSEQEVSSSDEVEEVLTDESEDSNQSDMVRTGKECRVDLPSLRVERGSSEDVVVPRQVTQAIYIKMQVGGKLTKEKVTRMLKKKLSEPAEIRSSWCTGPARGLQ